MHGLCWGIEMRYRDFLLIQGLCVRVCAFAVCVSRQPADSLA